MTEFLKPALKAGIKFLQHLGSGLKIHVKSLTFLSPALRLNCCDNHVRNGVSCAFHISITAEPSGVTLVWQVHQFLRNILGMPNPKVQVGNPEPSRKATRIHQGRAESLKQVFHIQSTRM
jgi:hypothetical protein